MRYHTATNDGLVGLNQAERDLIDARIARVSEFKLSAGGRELLPLEIAVVLDPASAKAGRRKCSRCSSILPATRSFFYTNGVGRLRSECKTCTCRDTTKRGRHQPRSPQARERERQYQRQRREAARAAGVALAPVTPVLRLQKNRSKDRALLKQATDPARIEHLKARIENLTHEIERLQRRAAQ